MTVTLIVRDGPRERVVLAGGDVVWSRAIALARVVDPGSGLPRAGVAARSLDDRVDARIASAGWLTIIGSSVITDAIAAGPESFDVELTTDRGRATTTIAIPAAATLPVVLPDVPLGSAAAAVAGTVRAAAFPHAPLANATVELRSTVPAGEACGLGVGVAAPHAAGVAVRVRPAPTAAFTSLDGAVAAGDEHIRLASVAGVAVSDWVFVAGEYREIIGLEPATRRVRVRHPLLRSRPDATPVRRATLAPPGATTTLTAATRRADSVVATAAPLNAQTVEIVDGSNTEICGVGIRTDASGTYRFGTVRELATVTVSADAAGFNPAVVTRPLGAERAEHVIDLSLTV